VNLLWKYWIKIIESKINFKANPAIKGYRFLSQNSILFISCILLVNSCGKNKDFEITYPDNQSYLISFESLAAERDTLYIKKYPSTKITAIANGKSIKFSWTASDGIIQGEGSQVTYIALPCCLGSIIITCEAKAHNRSEIKSLVIKVI
jgi:hypothetical protein